MTDGQKISRDRYVELWEEHIGDLIRLGWHCGKEDFERLKELQEELRGIVQRTADRRLHADVQDSPPMGEERAKAKFGQRWGI